LPEWKIIEKQMVEEYCWAITQVTGQV
jgi:hypothetical protein